jgi:hypothetical protein
MNVSLRIITGGATGCGGCDVRTGIAASRQYERESKNRTSVMKLLVSLLVLTFANQVAAR